MDPQDKQKLDRAVALSEENNRILKKLLSGMRWARVMTFIYWVIIIGVSIGAFYFLQPYINQLLKTYSSIQGSMNSFGSYLPKK